MGTRRTPAYRYKTSTPSVLSNFFLRSFCRSLSHSFSWEHRRHRLRFAAFCSHLYRLGCNQTRVWEAAPTEGGRSLSGACGVRGPSPRSARATCTGRCRSWRAGWTTWCWLGSGWPPSGAAPACSRCSSGPWSAYSGTTRTGTTWSTSARQTSPSSGSLLSPFGKTERFTWERVLKADLQNRLLPGKKPLPAGANSELLTTERWSVFLFLEWKRGK